MDKETIKELVSAIGVQSLPSNSWVRIEEDPRYEIPHEVAKWLLRLIEAVDRQFPDKV